METRFRKLNRIPGKEVRYLQQIAALVEITMQGLSAEIGNCIIEER